MRPLWFNKWLGSGDESTISASVFNQAEVSIKNKYFEPLYLCLKESELELLYFYLILLRGK